MRNCKDTLHHLHCFEHISNGVACGHSLLRTGHVHQGQIAMLSRVPSAEKQQKTTIFRCTLVVFWWQIRRLLKPVDGNYIGRGASLIHQKDKSQSSQKELKPSYIHNHLHSPSDPRCHFLMVATIIKVQSLKATGLAPWACMQISIYHRVHATRGITA